MPSRVSIVALSCFAAFLAGLAPSSDPSGENRPSPSAPDLVAPDPDRSVGALVLGVQDGDSITVSIDGEFHRVEVLGADAPEWIEQAESQRPYAAEARRFLTNLLHGERVLLFEPRPGATDPLGRRRAYVFREPDRLFVDLEIVRQGYGRVSTRAAEPYDALLRFYEQRARALRRGVWDPDYDPGESETTGPARPTETNTTPEPAAKPDPAPETTPDEQTAEERGWVWITRAGSKYHRADCPHLTASRTRVRRDSVRSSHEACKTCTPDA